MTTDLVAVFDTSVLFQQGTLRLFARSAQAGVYRACWPESCEQSAERELKNKGRLLALNSLAANLDLLDAGDRRVLGYEHHIETLVETHVDDRYVLAAAIEAHATHLVTDNLDDFSTKEAGERGITIVSHDDFGMLLYELNPAALARGIQRSPPDQLRKYLDTLGKAMPRTVRQLRPHFAKDLEQLRFNEC